MSWNIRKATECIVTHWSGGTTTELWIWPQGTSFKAMDWQFRLSTATVEVEESTFTPLSGVTRILLLLDGEMELRHEGHHIKLLTPFQQDHFQGGWMTKSIGKAVDFNLMTREGTEGTVSVLDASEEAVSDHITTEMTLLYVFKGSFQLGAHLLQQGDVAYTIEGSADDVMVPKGGVVVKCVLKV